MAGVEAGLINILIGPQLKEGFGRDLERQLDGDLRGAGRRSAQTFFSDFGAAATRAGKGLTAAFTLPLAAGATVAVQAAQQVRSGLAEVVTLTGETGEDARRTIEALSGEVAALSGELGVAQTELISGLYQAISAGVPRDNAFDFLRIASQAAIAGVTDIETAVDGLTTTLNAFGLPASEASAVADSLFAAVRAGKTDFEQLSRSLFNVAPAAAAAGLDFREINAAISTLTASGTPTSVATTQIRAALVGLQRPTEELQEIFGGLGFESRSAAIEQLGLRGSLEAVFEAAAGDQGVLQQLLGSVEAVAAANVLAGTSAEKFASDLQGQAEATGAASAAFEVIDETRAFDRLKTDVENLKISLGQELLPILEESVLPIVTDVVEQVKEWIAAFRELPQEQQENIIKAVGLVAALGPLLLIVGGIASGISALIGLFGFLLTPIGIVIVAIAAIAAMLIYLYNTNEEAAAIIRDIWPALQETFEMWGEKIGNVISSVIFFFQDLNASFQEAGERLGNNISAVIFFFQDLKDSIVELVGNVVTFFRELPGKIRSALYRLSVAVGTRVLEVIDWFKELPDRIFGFLRSLPGRMLDFGRELIRSLLNGIRDAARNLGGGVVDAIGGGLSAVGGFVGDIFRADGGPVTAGRPYIVGERGPELIVPRRSGTVIPNEQLGAGGDRYEITIVNPVAEEASLSIPAALRRAAYLRG